MPGAPGGAGEEGRGPKHGAEAPTSDGNRNPSPSTVIAIASISASMPGIAQAGLLAPNQASRAQWQCAS
jgi:hypothetical protein